MALRTDAIKKKNKKIIYQNKFKFDNKILLSNLEILNIKSEKKYNKIIFSNNFNPYFLMRNGQE